MRTVKNMIALFRANLKCICIKITRWKHFSYSPFLRMNADVDIRLDSKSSLSIKKGVLIDPRTVISATDGGHLNIGKMVGLNCNSMIVCHESITIGDNTIMGPNVYIYDHDHVFTSAEGVKRNEYKTSPVIIGQNCWVGAGTIILRGTKLGNNCLVAAGCVLKGKYPDGSVIIQKRNESVISK